MKIEINIRYLINELRAARALTDNHTRGMLVRNSLENTLTYHAESAADLNRAIQAVTGFIKVEYQ